MSSFTTELVSILRSFGIAEREAVCCGTVTVQQCIALQELAEASQDISGLAKKLGASSTTTTRLADGLERRGWAKRVRVPEDRRTVVVELTDEGRAEAARLRTLTAQLVDQIIARIPRGKHAQVKEAVQLLCGAIADVRKNTSDLCAGRG